VSSYHSLNFEHELSAKYNSVKKFRVEEEPSKHLVYTSNML
jgi:hypothetical protein